MKRGQLISLDKNNTADQINNSTTTTSTNSTKDDSASAANNKRVPIVTLSK